MVPTGKLIPWMLLAGCGPSVSTAATGSSSDVSGSTTTSSGVSDSTASSNDDVTATAGTLAPTSADEGVSTSGSMNTSASSSTSSGWQPSACDPSCQLPLLEERWTVWSEDVLGTVERNGLEVFAAAAAPNGNIMLRVVGETGGAVFRIDELGVAETVENSDAGVGADTTLDFPFAGGSESILTSFRESPLEVFVSRFGSDGSLLCVSAPGSDYWTHAQPLGDSDWALLGTALFDPSLHVVSRGDPCSPGSTVTFEDQGNPASRVGFAFFDPAFSIAGREAGETFVRSFDAAGDVVAEWSSAELETSNPTWSGATPDGRMLVAGSHQTGFGGEIAIGLAYVDVDTGAATIRTHPDLSPRNEPLYVVVDFVADDVPWLLFGDRTLSIAPLPDEDGQVCCPTTIEGWAAEGFEQFWALYAVPDGLIAATSAQRDGEGPPDVVVSRFGFVQ